MPNYRIPRWSKKPSKQYLAAVKKAKGKTTGTTHLECDCGGIEFYVGAERQGIVMKCKECNAEFLL